MGKVYAFTDVDMTTKAGTGTTYELVNEKVGAEKLAILLIEFEPELKATGIHYYKNREAVYIG